MLRKENDELQLLKTKVQELAQELAALKLEVNAKFKNDAIGYDSGKILGKAFGRAITSQESSGEVFSNKQMVNQFAKVLVNAMKAPQGSSVNSFGDN